jgi:hypothetical protein
MIWSTRGLHMEGLYQLLCVATDFSQLVCILDVALKKSGSPERGVAWALWNMYVTCQTGKHTVFFDLFEANRFFGLCFHAKCYSLRFYFGDVALVQISTSIRQKNKTGGSISQKWQHLVTIYFHSLHKSQATKIIKKISQEKCGTNITSTSASLQSCSQ